jgi:hypothetical protein
LDESDANNEQAQLANTFCECKREEIELKLCLDSRFVAEERVFCAIYFVCAALQSSENCFSNQIAFDGQLAE